MKFNKFVIILVSIFVVGVFMVSSSWKSTTSLTASVHKIWPIQGIDTVKYSRDNARGELTDLSFDVDIDKQVSDIAATGATHVALGTPYDAEFIPYLKRWVAAARKYKLNVWFRGNMSGWEGWFGYGGMSRGSHTSAIVSFIQNNASLFYDGDIFTSCPECENGGPGDPRSSGDVEGFRAFLVNEYESVKEAFSKINKRVTANFYSMNGDVARLVMDKPTTKALDGIVTIDHYVSSPSKLVSDIDSLANSSGGKVVLGEWGVPIPDINGNMTEAQQLAWVYDALGRLAVDKNVAGVNYWTNKGSSTALWNDNGSERKVVSLIHDFYSPRVIVGGIENEVGNGIYNAKVAAINDISISDYSGKFVISTIPLDKTLSITALGYKPQIIDLSVGTNSPVKVVLIKENEGVFFRFAKWLHNLLSR